jgi:hypothetical protein
VVRRCGISLASGSGPMELDAWGALLRGLLAWQPPDARPVPLPGLTVKGAKRHGAFVAEAYGPVAPGPASLAAFRATLHRLWGLC